MDQVVGVETFYEVGVYTEHAAQSEDLVKSPVKASEVGESVVQIV